MFLSLDMYTDSAVSIESYAVVFRAGEKVGVQSVV